VPKIIAVSPANDATGVAANGTITATFSEAMDPATINTDTFTLQKGTTPVLGTVSYSGVTATFTPSAALSSNSTYIAEINTGAKDPLGNALAGIYAWVFTTARDYSAWTDVGIIYSAPAGASAYYPSVIYDANGFGTGTPKYSMWYTDGAGATFLVTSTNGLQWGAPTTMVGLVNAHHIQVLYDANCFGAVPCNAGTTKYRM
jgi:hypothetical protein